MGVGLDLLARFQLHWPGGWLGFSSVITNLISLRSKRAIMSKDKEKEAILAAAQAVYEQKGARGATIDDIAKASKVDVKKVKAIYPTADAILDEMITRDVAESSELFTKVINDRGKADIKLTRLIR